MLIEVAQITGCIVIAGAQFNRSSTGTNRGEENGDDIFSEASFKDCGDIEQDATIAIGVGWNNDDLNRKDRFYTILKNREGGGVGKRFDLDFHGAYSYMASNHDPRGGDKGNKSIRTRGGKRYRDIDNTDDVDDGLIIRK